MPTTSMKSQPPRPLEAPGPLDEIVYIPMSEIHLSTRNPRKTMDLTGLNRLADSIRQYGVKQPIRVRPRSEGGYEIIVGERRWRATGMVGFASIPAIIDKGIDDARHHELALLENLHREDLNPVDLAYGYHQLAELGYTQAKIAQRLNRSPSHVSDYLSIVGMPEVLLDRVRQGEISMSQAIALGPLKAFPAIVEHYATRVDPDGPSLKPAAEMHEELSHDEIPYDWELVEKGIVRELEDLSDEPIGFDYRVTCRECPFGAYRENDGSPLCLKPEHATELDEAVRAEALALLTEMGFSEEASAERTPAAALPEGDASAIEPAPAPSKGPKVRMLNELPYDSFERLDGAHTIPSGCSENCTCRSVAYQPAPVAGGKPTPVPICLDRARIFSLRKRDTRGKNKKIRADLDARRKAARQILVSNEHLTSRQVVTLTRSIFRKPPLATIASTLELLGSPLSVEALKGGVGSRSSSIDLDALESVPPTILMRAALLLDIDDETERAKKNVMPSYQVATEFFLRPSKGDPQPARKGRGKK